MSTISSFAGRLAKPRSGDSVAELWRHVDAAAQRCDRLTQSLAASQQEIARLRSLIGTTSGLHPFKIYYLPVRLRLNRATPDDGNDWLRVRVRSGGVMMVSFDDAAPVTSIPLTLVTGTDGVDNPDLETYLDAPSSSDFPGPLDILVDAGESAFYIWVTIATGSDGTVSAVLHYGTDPSSAQPDADDWGSFPGPDATHQMIGRIDSLTLQSSGRLLIRQYARTDLTFFQVSSYTACTPAGAQGTAKIIGGAPA